MIEMLPIGSALYELSSTGSAEMPFTIAVNPAGVGALPYEVLKDVYFGIFEFLIDQFRATLGDPIFNDGQAAHGYPDGLTFTFLSLWRHAGRERFLGLRLNEQERTCVIEMGVR